jgi:hypothetical protein
MLLFPEIATCDRRPTSNNADGRRPPLRVGGSKGLTPLTYIDVASIVAAVTAGVDRWSARLAR